MMTDPAWLFGMGRKTLIQAALAMAAMSVFTIVCVSAMWLPSGRPVEPRLPKVTFGPAEEWPEIRNGVPELAPAQRSARPAGALSDRRAPVIEQAPGVDLAGSQDVPTARVVDQPSSALGTETPRTAAVGRQADVRVETPISTRPINLAEPRLVPEAPAPSSVHPPAPLPPPMSTIAPAGPSASATPLVQADGAEIKRIEARNLEAKTSEAKRAVPKRDKANDAPRAKRTAQSDAKADPRAPSDAASPTPRKPAGSARTRTAAAQTPATQGVDPPPTVAPAPEEPRTRLLGIPLPTGREVKECLLELRC